MVRILLSLLLLSSSLAPSGGICLRFLQQRFMFLQLSLTALVSLVSLAVNVSANSNLRKRATEVTTDASGLEGQTYDYIVVGGGLTGITVAARLAEDSSLKILVVEAGGDDRTNEQVYDIYAYSDAFGGPLDWAWPTDQGKTMRG